MSKLDFTDRTVAITGATGGLGQAMACELHKRGANLVLLDLDADLAEQVAISVGAPRRAIGLRADVTDLEQLETAFATAAETFGRIDLVIAAAGISVEGTPLHLADPDDWQRGFDINVLGVLRTFRAALPYVLASHGYLAAVSSMAAFVHNPLMGPYPPSKAAVWAICNSFRLELRHQHVTVSSIHPTYFKTPMTDAASSRPSKRHLMGDFRGAFTYASIDTVVEDILTGLQRREPQIVAPRKLRPIAMAPGLVRPLIERIAFHGHVIEESATMLEEEIRQGWKPADSSRGPSQRHATADDGIVASPPDRKHVTS